jgi:hypothetical protein
MDVTYARCLGGLDIEQLLYELNVLPLSDHRVEAKKTDFRIDCFAPKATAWLNGPVTTSCDLAGSR